MRALMPPEGPQEVGCDSRPNPTISGLYRRSQRLAATLACIAALILVSCSQEPASGKVVAREQDPSQMIPITECSGKPVTCTTYWEYVPPSWWLTVLPSDAKGGDKPVQFEVYEGPMTAATLATSGRWTRRIPRMAPASPQTYPDSQEVTDMATRKRSTQKRIGPYQNLPKSAFVYPPGTPRGGRRGLYPINSPARARNALARAAQSQTRGTYAAVERKVNKRYPGISTRHHTPKSKR